MSVRNVLIAAAAFAAGFVCIAPAAARAPVERVAVSYSDLNLASAQGRATLDRRVTGAVRQVCGRFVPARAGVHDAAADCADAAFASASAQRDALNSRHPIVSVSSAAY